MNTPFRLDDHPRRPQPLAPPPDGYFDRLPTEIMARVQPAEQESTAFGWFRALSMPLRTALASVAVLGSFAATFLLNQPDTSVTGARLAHVNLTAVPRTEMVQYLLASDERVSINDLSELPVADQNLVQEYLQASPDEVQAAMDEQPSEINYL
ncbi:hypothetical protein [Hymenobacter sp. GOD-10R]|uniref:hypothetical protein n=1 Tax=Hymenobacter sp. GOD-10R TaxID=3093922 RepID=UPI002D77BE89|nr:hypothetical protein [Hymenobacter sp. GOD-10R]WRQ30509.1 hypothetical protein SD425_09580 [Hymenobacter sp. GOD-10R]